MFRISLIIPTYNRAAQLIAALQSVVVQDLPPAEWECVVVNNRSDDDTAEQFAAFAAAHPACHLRMVDEQQAGLSHARNRGIAEAQAPLLAFIDDDEWIEPQFLRACSRSVRQRWQQAAPSSPNTPKDAPHGCRNIPKQPLPT